MAKDKDTPAKHFPDQFDDEEVLFMFRKHPVVMRKGLIVACAAMLAGPVYTFILTYTQPNNLPSIGFFFGSIAASFVLAMILFFPSWIAWFYSVFIVTDQRLIQITQKGLFHRTVVDLTLSQIQMVNYQISGLQETLLGFGTIMMQTYVGDLVIHDVHHPAEIQKKVLKILREKGITTTNFPANKDQADNDTEEDDE
jgi:Bacterial PH domain